MDLWIWDQLGTNERAQALARPHERSDRRTTAGVHRIVRDVRRWGWRALCKHAVRLDGREPERILVEPYAEAARRLLTATELDAIELARQNITAFHEACRPRTVEVETMVGVQVSKIWRPIDRVGLYVPGGVAPLFSTLLMLAIPARLAGASEIIVATPPRDDGTLEPVLALAAEFCGIESVWAVGGAQAIAALAFGAGAIEPVMKICGPGNAYVSEAKAQVAQIRGGPAIDMPAGPSELMVIADELADPRLVAADLLSQAEHDVAAQVLLVTTSTRMAQRVELALKEQVATLPRENLARRTILGARLILAVSVEQAIDIANSYAPEHLSLAVDNAERLVKRVRNAGAVFVGSHSAESFGDYLAGSSHVLPTDGAAAKWSGVSVETFMKAMTVQKISTGAASHLAAPTAALARLEGLEAHARAAELRFQSPQRAIA